MELRKQVLLLVIVAWRCVAALADEQQVGAELAPAEALLRRYNTLPVERAKVLDHRRADPIDKRRLQVEPSVTRGAAHLTVATAFVVAGGCRRGEGRAEFFDLHRQLLHGRLIHEGVSRLVLVGVPVAKVARGGRVHSAGQVGHVFGNKVEVPLFGRGADDGVVRQYDGFALLHQSPRCLGTERASRHLPDRCVGRPKAFLWQRCTSGFRPCSWVEATRRCVHLRRGRISIWRSRSQI
mmetsp:Transcript_35239/g.92470  ORF Transcript_35239/g.92470 Transcript_35239/m.92470 type:complete len:238 (-) Transcript_35239:73-786(-)